MFQLICSWRKALTKIHPKHINCKRHTCILQDGHLCLEEEAFTFSLNNIITCAAFIHVTFLHFRLLMYKLQHLFFPYKGKNKNRAYHKQHRKLQCICILLLTSTFYYQYSLDKPWEEMQEQFILMDKTRGIVLVS